MNERITDDIAHIAQPPIKEIEECVRRNPTTSVLVALAVGVVIGIAVRALRPEPAPQHRLAQLVDDIEARLRSVAEPALKRAGAFASGNAQAIADRMHDTEARAERMVRDAKRRLRRWFR
jgi:ElaB/YqjD/DUF883 family membrane-anchored ribosome-binding protein